MKEGQRERAREIKGQTYTEREREGLKADLLDWLIGYSPGTPTMTILHWKESISC